MRLQTGNASEVRSASDFPRLSSGHYAFLMGMAWRDSGALQVEQLFMREPTEEHSVLQALTEKLANRPVLVTFNGKTFDWPLLEARLRMTRSIALKTPSAHFDMFQAARRLWRLRLGSLKLTELERRVLGHERHEDLPSAFIPQVYCDFLRGGPVAPILAMLRHNRMDLQGLAQLNFSRLAA